MGWRSCVPIRHSGLAAAAHPAKTQTDVSEHRPMSPSSRGRKAFLGPISRGSLQLLSICALTGPTALMAQPRNPGEARGRLVQVDSNVRLEVVDWGGVGTPLVFLAGGGNTAHVFDDFARRFMDRFHVLGITRRGFGASATQLPPRDLDTLVTDIARVLDMLSLRDVVFVGHSIAGEEMTRFAELHPERCVGLIYIDAAYDRTGIDTLAKPQPPTPSPRIRDSDTAS